MGGKIGHMCYNAANVKKHERSCETQLRQQFKKNHPHHSSELELLVGASVWLEGNEHVPMSNAAVDQSQISWEQVFLGHIAYK